MGKILYVKTLLEKSLTPLRKYQTIYDSPKNSFCFGSIYSAGQLNMVNFLAPELRGFWKNRVWNHAQAG